MPARSQFSNAIHCSGCGAPGFARWEENGAPGQAGPERRLTSLSRGFRQDGQKRQPSGDPAIFCEQCGRQLAD